MELTLEKDRLTFPITGHNLVIESRCILCDEVADPDSVDHIFPKCAYRKDPEVFAGVIFAVDNLNLAPVCNDHHDEVDRNFPSKFTAYKKQGLVGLTLWIANEYPRSPDYRIRIVQFEQWQKLFTRIRNNIWSLNGNSTPLYDLLQIF